MWIDPKLNWSDQDECTPDDFNRIENNTDFMADEVGATVTVKTDWDRSGYPFADELNRIEQNIETIRFNASLPVAMGYQPPKIWNACIPIKFSDLYRMEKNLDALKVMLELIPQNYIYCGTFSCGGGAI